MLTSRSMEVAGYLRRQGGRTSIIRTTEMISQCQAVKALSMGSVDDRGVDDALQLAAEVEGAGRHQLGHEHHREVLLRVHPEDGRGRAAPVVVADAQRAGL